MQILGSVYETYRDDHQYSSMKSLSAYQPIHSASKWIFLGIVRNDLTPDQFWTLQLLVELVEHAM